jgi:hypothetical protein
MGISTLVHFNGWGGAARAGQGFMAMKLNKSMIMTIAADMLRSVKRALCSFDTWRILLFKNLKVKKRI